MYLTTVKGKEAINLKEGKDGCTDSGGFGGKKGKEKMI